MSVPYKSRRRQSWLLLTTFFLVMLAVVVGGILAFFPGILTSLPWYQPTKLNPPNLPNKEQIGLSDGIYAFDVGADRVDASLKTQAATQFAKGDKVAAMSLWKQAAEKDTSDAEALIYLEDQRVLASGLSYLTLVVGTILTGDADAITTGRDNLQGAYIAQKEYNNGVKLSGGKLVRLLIANAGSKSDSAAEIAQQVVQAAKGDSSIVGVMGWPYSTYAEKAIPVFNRAHIPMVSQTASADSLIGISRYFFRVAPPNKSQAIAGAKYAEQQLHASRVALFADPNDSYSSSLADDFKKQFADVDGNQIVDTENYTVGNKASLRAVLQKALNSNPDLIYFAGYADDVTMLVGLLTSRPNLQVLGGDGLYGQGGYPSSSGSSFTHLHFTAFAYPDEWGLLGMSKPHPFFSEYTANFNPAGADHAAQPYGFTRADNDVILSYDATIALLQGCQNALTVKNALTPDALQNGLTQTAGAKAIQGVSGQISFGSDGDPVNKAVVILYVDQQGRIHMLQPNGVRGCFTLEECR